MHGLEYVGVALVILFYIVRAVYRGLRWLFLGLRRALGVAPTPARPMAQQQQPALPVPQAQPQAPPRLPPVLPTQPAAPTQRVRSLPGRPPAAQPPQAAPETTPPDTITLRPNGKDLVQALIWQEILSPPRSQSPRRKP